MRRKKKNLKYYARIFRFKIRNSLKKGKRNLDLKLAATLIKWGVFDDFCEKKRFIKHIFRVFKNKIYDKRTLRYVYKYVNEIEKRRNKRTKKIGLFIREENLKKYIRHTYLSKYLKEKKKYKVLRRIPKFEETDKVYVIIHDNSKYFFARDMFIFDKFAKIPKDSFFLRLYIYIHMYAPTYIAYLTCEELYPYI